MALSMLNNPKAERAKREAIQKARDRLYRNLDVSIELANGKKENEYVFAPGQAIKGTVVFKCKTDRALFSRKCEGAIKRINRSLSSHLQTSTSS